jgi:hypothetical protein
MNGELSRRKKSPAATAPVSPITKAIHDGTNLIVDDNIGVSTFVYYRMPAERGRARLRRTE